MAGKGQEGETHRGMAKSLVASASAKQPGDFGANICRGPRAFAFSRKNSQAAERHGIRDTQERIKLLVKIPSRLQFRRL